MVISARAADPVKIHITEVGLRDGLQSETTPVDLRDKVALARALISAGVRSFELSSFVSPRAVPQLHDAAGVFAALKAHEDVEMSFLVANEKGMERAMDAGVRHVVFFASASESHNIKNVNRSRRESLAGMHAMARMAEEAGIEVHGAVATAFSCPFEGAVPVEDMVDMARAYAQLGATRIKLGDTIGTATPSEVSRRVAALRAALPDTEICLHFHNTRGIGLVCAWQGLADGVRHFESSIGGLGGCPFVPEATGNISTEDFVYLLEESGYDTGMDLTALTEIARQAQAVVGHDLPGLMMKAGPRLRTWPMDAARTAQG